MAVEEPMTPLSRSLLALLDEHLSRAPDDATEMVCAMLVEEIRSSKDGLDSDLDSAMEDILMSCVEDELLTELGGARVVAAEVLEAARDRVAIRDILAAAPVEFVESVTVGSRGVAVLDEDEDWHACEVTSVDGDGVYTVLFSEYGKSQSVQRKALVLNDEIADDGEASGSCPMCRRIMPLTKHHLIPRTTHEFYRKKGLTEAELQTGADICRQCHSQLHRTWDEETLAAKYNTLEKLMATEEMQRWAKYAASQKGVGASKANALSKELLRHIQTKR